MLLGLGIKTIIVATLVAAPDFNAKIVETVIAHYDSIMKDRVVEWQLEIKRCQGLPAEKIEIIRARGDEGDLIPRGSRLCWVDVIADGIERSVPVTLVVKPVETVPVAKSVIQARSQIGDSLVKWRELETTKLGAACLPSKEQLKSMWSKVRIPAGAIITMNRLMPIPAVVIGHEIKLVSRIGVVDARIDGQALEDGRIGERIRVLNTSSGQRLKGVVESKGIVVVE